MMTKYYRINRGQMTGGDLHDNHVSRTWVGEEDERPGLSVCRTYGDLVQYFTGNPGETSPGRGAALRGAHLVELEGEEIGDGWEDNEVLIRPTVIISSEPVAEKFLADVVAAVDERWANNGERACYIEERDEIVIQRRCHACDGTGHGEDGECWECDGKGWK